MSRDFLDPVGEHEANFTKLLGAIISQAILFLLISRILWQILLRKHFRESDFESVKTNRARAL